MRRHRPPRNLELIRSGRLYSSTLQWDSEREGGFESMELLYDGDGRLVGIDLKLPKRSASPVNSQ